MNKFNLQTLFPLSFNILFRTNKKFLSFGCFPQALIFFLTSFYKVSGSKGSEESCDLLTIRIGGVFGVTNGLSFS